MPDQQRRAILLREWQGLSYREIAEELELSQSAVETLIFRARRSLAKGLTEPHAVKPQAKRTGFRRVRHIFDLTTLLAAAKSLLAGSAALKATTAAVAVTALAGGAATVAPELLDPKPKPPLAVVDASVTQPKPGAKPAAQAVVAAGPPAAFVERAAPVSVAAPVRGTAPLATRSSRSAAATKRALPVQASPVAHARSKRAQPQRVGTGRAETKAERTVPPAPAPKAAKQTKRTVAPMRAAPKVAKAPQAKPTRRSSRAEVKSRATAKKPATPPATAAAGRAEAPAVSTADRPRGSNGNAAGREK